MPRLNVENIGTGDMSWLASDHGITNARTATIDVAAFTAKTHYPNGYLPSGLPVNAADEGAVKPWTGGDGEQLGFLLTDQSVGVDEKLPAPVLRHGLVKTNRLPVDFTAPAAGAAGFTFIKEA